MNARGILSATLGERRRFVKLAIRLWSHLLGIIEPMRWQRFLCLIVIASPLVLGGCFGPCGTPLDFLPFWKDKGCDGPATTAPVVPTTRAATTSTQN